MKIRFRQLISAARQEWVAIFLVVVAMCTVGVNVGTHSLETSPIDEWAYIDYTDKALSEGFLRLNEEVSPYTVAILSCHGIIPHVTYGTCGSASAGDLPYSGLSQAATYMPVFFQATAIVGAALQFFIGGEKLTAWRLVGGIWLSLALIFIVMAFRRWNIPDFATLTLGLLLIASPYTWLAHTFLSTDAPSLLVGAVILYMSTRIRDRTLSPFWLLVVFPIAISLKVTNIAAITFAILYLFIAWTGEVISNKRQKLRATNLADTVRFILAPVLGLVIAASVEALWIKFVQSTAIPTLINMDQGVSTKLTLLELVSQAFNFLGSAITANPVLTSKFLPFFAPLSWLCIAGVVSAVLLIKTWDYRAEISTAILLSAILSAPLLAISLQLGTGTYFPVASRYGGSLIPVFLLATGFVLRNKAAQYILIVYAVSCMAVGLAFSLRLA